ncbi:MAG: AIPR family protein [Sulfolobaceae archaeon]
MNERNSSDKAYAKIIATLKIFHPELKDSVIERKNLVTDGQKDAYIDGFYRGKNTLELYSVSNKKFDYSEGSAIGAELYKLLYERDKKSIESDDGLNEYVRYAIKSARDHINKGGKVKLNIVFSKMGKGKESIKDKLRIEEEKMENKNLILDFIDNKKLVELYLSKEEKIDYTWKLELDGKRFIDYEEGERECIIALIDAKMIVNLMKEYIRKGYSDENNPDRDFLFSKNIRGLIRKEYVSEGIKKTIDNSPNLFHIFNNGLVITGDDVYSGAGEIIIKNPQIINGLQTVKNLYELRNHPKFKDVKIVCKFYGTTDQETIKKICNASNTQIPVAPSDLRSNDFIQKVIEEFFRINGIKYARKKGNKGQRKDVEKEVFAQWLHSCINEEPAEAKNRKAQLFANLNLYDRIFKEYPDPKELITIYKIGKFINEKIKSLRDKKLIRTANTHIIAGMYFYLKNHPKSKIQQTTYNKVMKALNSVLKEKKKEYGSDYNKIFTKDKETWRLLKSKL